MFHDIDDGSNLSLLNEVGFDRDSSYLIASTEGNWEGFSIDE